MENAEIPREAALSALQQRLRGAGIDTAEWGTGAGKTLEHLQKEIEGGETVLVTGEDGELLRRVVVGGADVFYTSPDGKRYRLSEDRQVFADSDGEDGESRERRRNLGHSVSEKMKPNEDPEEAMVRGIREELGVEGEIDLTATGTEEQLRSSPSYPGLQSQYIRHGFEATLSDQQFRPEGYVEIQEDKSTYFVWKEVE